MAYTVTVDTAPGNAGIYTFADGFRLDGAEFSTNEQTAKIPYRDGVVDISDGTENPTIIRAVGKMRAATKAQLKADLVAMSDTLRDARATFGDFYVTDEGDGVCHKVHHTGRRRWTIIYKTGRQLAEVEVEFAIYDPAFVAIPPPPG